MITFVHLPNVVHINPVNNIQHENFYHCPLLWGCLWILFDHLIEVFSKVGILLFQIVHFLSFFFQLGLIWCFFAFCHFFVLCLEGWMRYINKDYRLNWSSFCLTVLCLRCRLFPHLMTPAALLLVPYSEDANLLINIQPDQPAIASESAKTILYPLHCIICVNTIWSMSNTKYGAICFALEQRNSKYECGISSFRTRWCTNCT